MDEDTKLLVCMNGEAAHETLVMHEQPKIKEQRQTKNGLLVNIEQQYEKSMKTRRKGIRVSLI